MSFDAHKAVAGLRNISIYERGLMSLLADHVNREGFCWHSNKTLAKELNITVRRLQQIIRGLEARKLMKVEHRYRDNKSQRSNKYHLLIDDLFMGGGEILCKKEVKNVSNISPLESGTSLISKKESKTCASAISKQEKDKKTLGKKLEKNENEKEKLEKYSLEEIKSRADLYQSNGTFKPAWLWRTLYEHYQGDECLLPEGDIGKHNHKYDKHGQKVITAMYLVMDDWIRFIVEAESQQGAFNLPHKPAVGFFVQYLTTAVAMSNKPKPIPVQKPKPLPVLQSVPKPVPKPQPEPQPEPEPLDIAALKAKHGL